VIGPTPVTSLMVVAFEPTRTTIFFLSSEISPSKASSRRRRERGELRPHPSLAPQDPAGAQRLGLRDQARDQATVPWQQDRQIGMESFLDPRPLVNELVTVVDEELQIATGPFGRNRRKLRLSSYNTSDRQRVSGVRLAGPPSPPALFVGQHRRNLPDVLSRPFKCSGQPGPETTSTLNSEPTPFTDRPSPPEWVDVIVDRWRTKALIRPDLPLSAEGWFELLE